MSAQLPLGQRSLILGASGCGKSSLLLALTGFIPQRISAEVSGDIRVCGQDPKCSQPHEFARLAAHYFQDAEQNLCGLSVEDEIAFALENRATPETKILDKVDAIMGQVGLPADWKNRRVASLSGGEKQLVALASVLAQDTSVIIADEPMTNLSPLAADRIKHLIFGRHSHRSVIGVDHQTERISHLVDKALALDGHGSVVLAGPVQSVLADPDKLQALGIEPPFGTRLVANLKRNGICLEDDYFSTPDVLHRVATLTDEGRGKAHRIIGDFACQRETHLRDAMKSARPLVTLQSAECAPLNGPVVLRGVNLEIRAGEIVTVLGANGAGKSTLATVAAGVLKPRSGRRDGPLGGIAFQRPENQFVASTVREEIESAVGSGAETALNHSRILADWGLSQVAEQHPYRLSAGQKRLLSVASIAIGGRFPLIVLDEPLTGLDLRGRRAIADAVAHLSRNGFALLIVTHDLDFALRVSHRSLLLQGGRILADGNPETLLSNNLLLRQCDLRPPPRAVVQTWLERYG